ncbi:MAG: AtpZ/AtpI family protein [Anaerolineales bacterium]|jgi:F0F1-type ATP synthase assembly protein I|nr:AtpZ/AtpI family protein [Anaerolineales bacterium]
MSQPTNQNNNAFNMTLATVVGQVGCLTPIILIAALFAGLWLDRVLETRPLFTIIFIVISAPAAVVALVYIVRKATDRLKPVSTNEAKSLEEEVNRD